MFPCQLESSFMKLKTTTSLLITKYSQNNRHTESSNTSDKIHSTERVTGVLMKIWHSILLATTNTHVQTVCTWHQGTIYQLWQPCWRRTIHEMISIIMDRICIKYGCGNSWKTPILLVTFWPTVTEVIANKQSLLFMCCYFSEICFASTKNIYEKVKYHEIPTRDMTA